MINITAKIKSQKNRDKGKQMSFNLFLKCLPNLVL